MNKIIFLILILIFSIGCQRPDLPVYVTDKKEWKEIFFTCLEKGPRGQDNTKYKDWAEVVDECDDAALRIAKTCIKNCIEEEF